MKRILRLLLLLAALAALSGAAMAAGKVQIPVYNGKQLNVHNATQIALTCDGEPLETDVPAFLENSRTMVPIRVISEKLDATVSWDQKLQQVSILLDEHLIQLTIDSAEALVDGEPVRMPGDVPAILVKYDGSSRTMVPVRFVAEQLERGVVWDGATYTVDIETTRQTAKQIELPEITEEGLRFSCGMEEAVCFSLPGRLVFDLPGASIPKAGGMLPVNGAQITSVRYSQYDNGDYGYAKVVRVVLDLCDGVTQDEITVLQQDGVVTIPIVPLEEEAPVEQDPEQIPEDPEAQPPEEDPEQPGSEESEPPEAQEPPSDPAVGPWLSTPIEVPENVYAINITQRGFVDDGETIICLDAGHGGRDPGTLFQTIYEKDITLAVTLRLGELLEQAGYTVVYTRTDDRYVSLEDRVRYANLSWADVFVSVHVNSCPQQSVTGVETYHWFRNDKESRALAQSIQGYLVAATRSENRGVKTADFTVIHHTIMPAALAEIGFLSNYVECGLLVTPEYQEKIAEGLYWGISSYVDGYLAAHG